MRGALLWTRRGIWWRAHLLEGRSVSELAAAHGVHRSWIYKLLARYRAGGYGALERRSRAPRSSPNRTSAEMVEAIVSLREQLEAEGHDCGAATIAFHLAERFEQVPSRSTIWRLLKKEGLVVSQPQKRPRSSLLRFEAELPNEMWQADVTHWALAGAGHAEISQHARRSLPPVLGLASLSDRQGRRRSRRLSHGYCPARSAFQPAL